MRKDINLRADEGLPPAEQLERMFTERLRPRLRAALARGGAVHLDNGGSSFALVFQAPSGGEREAFSSMSARTLRWAALTPTLAEHAAVVLNRIDGLRPVSRVQLAVIEVALWPKPDPKAIERLVSAAGVGRLIDELRAAELRALGEP